MTDNAQSTLIRLPALTEIFVGDEPAAWTRAGFSVNQLGAGPAVQIGNIMVRLGSGAESDVPPANSDQSSDITRPGSEQSGIQGWSMSGLSDEQLASTPSAPSGQSLDLTSTSTEVLIDGIRTLVLPTDRSLGKSLDKSNSSGGHSNLVTHLDHVVVTTKNMQRTIEQFQHAGFELRRIRDISPNQQAFFWAGETILEVVGPAEPIETSGVARLWGLAMTSSDLETAGEHLGARLGPVTSAVQAGRRIATLRGKDIGISVPIVLMSAHPKDRSETKTTSKTTNSAVEGEADLG